VARAGDDRRLLLINNLIGLGVGPLLIGTLSDGLRERYGDDSLRIAALAVLVFYLVAALLMMLAARRLREDWVEEAPVNA
jgi:hypothetical protein